MGDNTVGRDVPSANMGYQVIDTTQIATPPPICFDLLAGPSDQYYFKWGVPLHRAAMESDWKTAEEILQQQPNLATAELDECGLNVLHVACEANSSTYFIKQLVANYYMNTPEDLALRSKQRYTGLMYLAESGNNVEAARFMIEKNVNLPLMHDIGYYPVTCAISWGNGKMASYLLSLPGLHQIPMADRFNLLKQAICTYMYDVALEIVNMFPYLALYKDEEGRYALQYLAGKRPKPHSPHEGWSWTKLMSGKYEARQNKNMDDNYLQLVDKLWEKILLNGTKEDRELLSRTVLDATKNGNIELIVKIFTTYPPSISMSDENKRHTFSLAILNRQVEIFNLIYELEGRKVQLITRKDEEDNTSLHMAAKMPPKESLNVVTGAALQMQRELLWFKEVDNLVPPPAKDFLNRDNYTAHSLFTENHETLRKDGEEWMKFTATSCSLMATLVATIAFTSVLTLPGGDNQNNGIPIFQRDPIFITFAIADALSLVLSTIAIGMFLGILTSRYAQDDFLISLPFKLLVGFGTLLLSIAFTMVAFASAFFIIFKAKLPLTSIPAAVAILTAIPIAIFAAEQFALLIDIFRSTYGAKKLFRNNHRIYKEKKNGGQNWLVRNFLQLKTLALNWLGRND